MPQRSLKDILAGMAVVDASRDYYAVTLTVDENGQNVLDTQTHWVGFADEHRLTELRVPSIMKPEAMIRHWKVVEQPYVVVNDETAWFVYFQIGGNALVEKSIAENYLADTFRTMRSEPAIRIADYGSSFGALGLLPKHTAQRAPTPKLRMEVLNRDGRRCRICGSSPANNVHVELHVHHIRPWEKGGHTHVENLITLCHTCHKGLDPHEDHSLFDLLPQLKLGEDHSDAVLRYRERLQVKLEEFEKPRQPTKHRTRPRHPRNRRPVQPADR
jgi:hypothetical protein